jgi:predicted DNA-binding protein with PD1-like motif
MRSIAIDEQIEVLAFTGDVAVDEDGEPQLHAHVVVGKAHGGHLLEARVWPTLEVVLAQPPTPLRERLDPATGLALIDLDRL